MKKLQFLILFLSFSILSAQSTPIRDYLNVMKRSDLRGWIFQHGQLIASMGHSVMNDAPIETWYFDETSMAVDDGTDNSAALKPFDIPIEEPGRYLKTMVQSDWNNTINKPVIFSGVYSDLTGKPSLFSGTYNDLTGKPSLFSGAYNDLTGKPTIPAQVNLIAGNRISITGTYPNITISYIEPIPVIVTRSVNSNYTISATKQANVFYSVTCSVTNPLLVGSSTANAYLEYSINSGTTWVNPAQTGNSSSVGVAVAIQLTNGQTGFLSCTIPANALVRIRTTITGTASVVYAVGQETY